MKSFLKLFNSLVLLAAAVLAVFGWQASRQAVVLVEWSTASELETAGFNLYRRQGDQPAVRVNAELIPASPDPLTGGSYQYEDHAVRPGQSYIYELEEVETSGNSHRIGEVEVRAVSGGKIEGGLALALLAAGLAGLLYARRLNRAEGPALTAAAREAQGSEERV